MPWNCDIHIVFRWWYEEATLRVVRHAHFFVFQFLLSVSLPVAISSDGFLMLSSTVCADIAQITLKHSAIQNEHWFVSRLFVVVAFSLVFFLLVALLKMCFERKFFGFSFPETQHAFASRMSHMARMSTWKTMWQRFGGDIAVVTTALL